MAVRSPRSVSAAARPRLRLPWQDLLDVLAMGVWSAMLFRYWIGGKLLLLLHPDYAWLSNLAAIVLLLLAAFKGLKIWLGLIGRTKIAVSSKDQGHVTLLPATISSALILGVAVFGLIYTPRAFASQTAIQRGVSDSITLTRAQPRRFVRAAAPEERTIIDWIRLINVYPEPDAYEGEAVAVSGFVIHPEEWSADHLMVARFVLTCCAADAYPVGLPVQLPAGKTYPVDSWIEVTGQMTTETLDGRRQLAIAPTAIKAIEEPRNPYQY